MPGDEEKTTASPKKGKWFARIPRNILFSPGGLVLVAVAVLIEIGDLIPIPILDQIWELPLEIIFMALLSVVAKPPIKSLIIPFVIERIPLLNDILPTWLIRLFM